MDEPRASLLITPSLAIPLAEIVLRATPSGGPGGQNVNKVSTRVELRFDLEGSPSLTAEQRLRLREKLATRLTSAGEIVLSSDRYRSQLRNRQEVQERFATLLREALRPRRARRRTRPTRASVERRLQEKGRRASVKRERRAGRARDRDA
ncbi:MAG: alternative ribosome rescue aminoacyl-tRNA hydrolase ArfB [Planctomycetota bacterium]